MIGHAVDLVFQLAEERQVARRRADGRAAAIVVPASSGRDSHRDSRKSRDADRAVQSRAARGAGSAWIVSSASPRWPVSNAHEIRGHRAAGDHLAEEGPQAVDRPIAVLIQAMAGVGQLDQVLRALQPVPVEVQRVERPVAVVGPVDQQLGLGEPVAIRVRVDHLPELGAGRASGPSPSARARRSRGSARCTCPRP